MTSIKLPSFSPESAAEALRRVSDGDDILCSQGNLFWLGSVDAQNSEHVQRFIELCKQGQFAEVGEFTDISQSCVYAIFARRANNAGYRLFVLQMNPNPHTPQHCLLSKVFDDLEVIERQGPVEEINLKATLTLKDIFKNAFR